MSPNKYKLGDVVRMSATFELENVLTDPTVVSLKLTPPPGSSSYLSPVVKDSTGKYHYDYTPATTGSYKYRYYGTGTVVAEADAVFYVEPA